ncbi:hypothetical protein EKH55_5952 (plasmid) [Sinorhizobium alkalisoli]|nr:hypothetical protein [Sinorhizobium alkalisoli]QFI70826.1 hypothetical protein EKH55_5952 [Sinorhizobium alkalisoli]
MCDQPVRNVSAVEIVRYGNGKQAGLLQRFGRKPNWSIGAERDNLGSGRQDIFVGRYSKRHWPETAMTICKGAHLSHILHYYRPSRTRASLLTDGVIAQGPEAL